MAMTDTSLDEHTTHVTTLVTGDGEEHKSGLLEQFYLTLGVTYLASPRVEGSPVHGRIARLLTEPRSWRNAYEIEQLLCFVTTEEQLETELARRLAEAKALKLPHVDAIDEELHDTSVPAHNKRIVLHRLLNDLQWFYSKRIHHRAASNRLMLRVSSLFIVALVTLFLVLFIQFFAQGRAASVSAGQTQTAAGGAGGDGAATQDQAGANGGVNE